MRPALAAFGLATLSVSVAAQEAAPPSGSPAAAASAAEPAARRFEELSLAVGFPAELSLVEQPPPTQALVRAAWLGKLGSSELRARLILVSRANYGFDEPSQVIDLVGSELADSSSGGNPAFHFDTIEHLPGRFGEADYGTLATSTEAEPRTETGNGTEPVGPSQVFRFAGLLESMGYYIELRARPPLAEADAELVREALSRSVAYDGPQRDPKWTEAEAESRWKQDAPDSLTDEEPELLRSAHYIVLTNSSGGKTFSKKMEECYAAIRKVYPFDEVPGRRLMPVFLFRTNDQYYEYFAKNTGMTVEDGKRTGGVASADWYSTWYEAPGDPVHIHEGTHQIFANRLGLRGGGSWFQEGVAEYMSTQDNERGAAARAVKKGQAKPLREFMAVQSLVFSSQADDKSGADEAGSQYEMAALFVEFMRESKFGKAKFPEYIRAVGAVPRNHVKAIDAAIRRVYGVDLDELEAQFVDYCKKR